MNVLLGSANCFAGPPCCEGLLHKVSFPTLSCSKQLGKEKTGQKLFAFPTDLLWCSSLNTMVKCWMFCKGTPKQWFIVF